MVESGPGSAASILHRVIGRRLRPPLCLRLTPTLTTAHRQAELCLLLLLLLLLSLKRKFIFRDMSVEMGNIFEFFSGGIYV